MKESNKDKKDIIKIEKIKEPNNNKEEIFKNRRY